MYYYKTYCGIIARKREKSFNVNNDFRFSKLVINYYDTVDRVVFDLFYTV